MDPVGHLVRTATGSDDPSEREAAFLALVERFQDMAYGCAYARLGDAQQAEDVAQEAFIAAYTHLAELRRPDAFPGWFRRIVLTYCHRTERTEDGRTVLDEERTLADAEAQPAAVVEGKELQAALQEAIASLPPGQRLATVLFYIDGYSQQEVAAFLEVPEAAVKQRLHRARRHLRERILAMVRDDLQGMRPSQDERFVQAVRLALELERVATDGQLAAIEAFLVDGWDVNAAYKDGQTLLHWAAQQGHIEAAELLLRSGAVASLTDRQGLTARDYAEERGHNRLAQLLRRYERKA